MKKKKHPFSRKSATTSDDSRTGKKIGDSGGLANSDARTAMAVARAIRKNDPRRPHKRRVRMEKEERRQTDFVRKFYFGKRGLYGRREKNRCLLREGAKKGNGRGRAALFSSSKTIPKKSTYKKKRDDP